MVLKLVSYKDKLPALQKEVEEIRDSIRVLELQACDSPHYRNDMAYLNGELKKAYTQLHFLLKCKPIFIEDSPETAI